MNHPNRSKKVERQAPGQSPLHRLLWLYPKVIGALASDPRAIEFRDIERRIVSCVNACEGLTDRELEFYGGNTFVKYMSDVEKERDELLAALVAMRKAFDQLLPGISNACKDYTNINEASIMADRAIDNASK